MSIHVPPACRKGDGWQGRARHFWSPPRASSSSTTLAAEGRAGASPCHPHGHCPNSLPSHPRERRQRRDMGKEEPPTLSKATTNPPLCPLLGVMGSCTSHAGTWLVSQPIVTLVTPALSTSPLRGWDRGGHVCPCHLSQDYSQSSSPMASARQRETVPPPEEQSRPSPKAEPGSEPRQEPPQHRQSTAH